MDCVVHRVTESWTQLADFHFHIHSYTWSTCEEEWSEVTQSCLTLCNPMDCSLPGSSVYGIFQARALEWAAISFSETPRKSSNFCEILSSIYYSVETKERSPALWVLFSLSVSASINKVFCLCWCNIHIVWIRTIFWRTVIFWDT